MISKIIVTGMLRKESLPLFQNLPDCRIVFGERFEDIAPADCQDADIFVGDLRPEYLPKMPNLRFVQLYSAGANRFSWLPAEITLANAYGDSIAEHMITTVLMAMKRMPE